MLSLYAVLIGLSSFNHTAGASCSIWHVVEEVLRVLLGGRSSWVSCSESGACFFVVCPVLRRPCSCALVLPPC